MGAIKVESVVVQDGVLHVAGLPFRQGDRVQATLTLVRDADESERQAALARLNQLCRESAFTSTGPYPTRDELHERP